MEDYKIILGYLNGFVALAANVPYLRNIFLGKTKPHAFSWLVWSVTTLIVFLAQITKQAGAGAWITGCTSLACFVVFILSLIKGERGFVLFDWLSLVAALFSLILWWFAKDPTMSVILLTVTDVIGYFPTYRKGYYKPNEETISLFLIGAINFIISLFAIEIFTVATWFYPVMITLANGILVVIVLWRRRVVKM